MVNSVGWEDCRFIGGPMDNQVQRVHKDSEYVYVLGARGTASLYVRSLAHGRAMLYDQSVRVPTTGPESPATMDEVHRLDHETERLWNGLKALAGQSEETRDKLGDLQLFVRQAQTARLDALDRHVRDLRDRMTKMESYEGDIREHDARLDTHWSQLEDLRKWLRRLEDKVQP